MFERNAVEDRKRQPVMKILPYKEMLELCLFTCRNLDMPGINSYIAIFAIFGSL